jgi:hypothetical protein
MSSRLRALAQETVRIIDLGGYQTSSGQQVRLAEQIKGAVAGTRLYLPEE